MKTLQSLLAVSVLAAAGAANATTIGTVDFTDTYTVYGQKLSGAINTAKILGVGVITGTGGVLDSSGTLTFATLSAVLTEWNGTAAVGTQFTDTYSNAIFHGTVSGSNFIITSEDYTYGTCVAGISPGCAGVPASGTVLTGDTTPAHSIALSGTTSWTTTPVGISGQPAYKGDAFSFTATPAVPVPAAAWLFGSGLLGLAGTARRRRAA